MLVKKPGEKLARFQFFYLPTYYPGGAMADVEAEGESIDELMRAIDAWVKSRNSSLDRDPDFQVLDLQQRVWLPKEQVSAIMHTVAERNTREG